MAQLLATMLDPFLLVGSLVIWLSLRRLGWLAPWWVSLIYASAVWFLAWGGGNPNAMTRMWAAVTILTAIYWALGKAIGLLRHRPAAAASIRD